MSEFYQEKFRKGQLITWNDEAWAMAAFYSYDCWPPFKVVRTQENTEMFAPHPQFVFIKVKGHLLKFSGSCFEPYKPYKKRRGK